MTTTKETIKEDPKSDTPIEICQARPKALGKRKIIAEPINVVKQLKIIEERTADVESCSHCSKKLKFINTFTCRCKKSFCNKHRFFDQHECLFDFKTEAKNKLMEANPKVVAKKLE